MPIFDSYQDILSENAVGRRERHTFGSSLIIVVVVGVVLLVVSL